MAEERCVCYSCGLKGRWRESWTHNDHMDFCPVCSPLGMGYRKPCGWFRQAHTYAIDMQSEGGRPVVLLSESRKGKYPHILFLENGYDVRFSPYLAEGSAYIVDGRHAFPTDAETQEQLRQCLSVSWL